MTLSEVVGDFQRSSVSKGHELNHLGCIYIYILAGGFKYFSLFGEYSQYFDSYFSDGWFNHQPDIYIYVYIYIFRFIYIYIHINIIYIDRYVFSLACTVYLLPSFPSALQVMESELLAVGGHDNTVSLYLGPFAIFKCP